MNVPLAAASFIVSHGLKYSGVPSAERITMIGMSSPRASLLAAYSRRHHPRARHEAKSQITPGRSACSHGGASTHIIEQRSMYVGIESTAAASCWLIERWSELCRASTCCAASPTSAAEGCGTLV